MGKLYTEVLRRLWLVVLVSVLLLTTGVVASLTLPPIVAHPLSVAIGLFIVLMVYDRRDISDDECDN